MRNTWNVRLLCPAIFYLFITASSLPFVHADEIQDERIKFVETMSYECDALGGKLVSIQYVDGDKTAEVWLERWLVGMSTGEHKKYVLRSGKEPLNLGCSMIAEGDQHWKISDIQVK